MVQSDKIQHVLSKNIKSIRTNSNMTQDELAEKTNIATQFLRDIEAEKKIGSMKTFINICLALQTTPNALLYDFFNENIENDENLTLKINKLSEKDKLLIIKIIDYLLDNNNI